MDISKVFQSKNIPSICEQLLKYCELYINSSPSPSPHNLRSFHTFFPTLLVYVFGSPNVRGWMQIETHELEDEAIRKLLSVKSHFFRALVKLSEFPEYSYDLVVETLPADVRKLLSTGAVQLLPNVYKDCTYLKTSASSNSVDIKAAATRQSTLASFGGERRIKFNMVQFYLYYFVSVATWPTQPMPIIFNNATQHNQAATLTKSFPSNRFSSYSTPMNNTQNTSYSSNSYNNNPNYPHTIYGKPRAVSYGVYSHILEEYMLEFIPIGVREDFPPIVNSFFFDALMELFIRVTYVPSTYQGLSSDLLFYITAFVKYIVRHDLRQCDIHSSRNTGLLRSSNTTTTLFSRVYTAIKDELCLLISRLALNYKKDDDYLYIVELWAVWTAPWKFGATPKSLEKYDYMPIQHGWAPFIFDNLLFYLYHTDIFLQRTSTFLYKDPQPPNYNANVPPQNGQPVQTSAPSPSPSSSPYAASYNNFNGTIRGQLRILYRIINIFKAEGLLDYFAYVEKAIERLQMGSSIMDSNSSNNNNNYFKEIAIVTFKSENLDSLVCQKLKMAHDFIAQVETPNWKPKGLFTNDIQPRSENLLKTAGNVYNAYLTEKTASNSGLLQLNSNTAKNAKKYAQQFGEAYELLTATFRLTDSALSAQDSLSNDVNVPTSATSTDSKPTAHATTNNTTYTNTVNQRRPYIPQYATLNEHGVLSEEDRIAIKEGRKVCSLDNVRALGIRAETHVRSYELECLVNLTLRADRKINFYYDYYIPPHNRASFLPRKLSIRFLACPKNAIWTTILLLLLFYKFVL